MNVIQGRPNELAQRLFHIFLYYHPNNRKTAALNLWDNAQRIFSKAKVVEDFETFESIPCGKEDQPPIESVMPFLMENIMDKMRIITCFENFMKGTLLLNGYIVHRISGKKPDLRKAQNNRPIGVAEIFTDASFSSNRAESEHETTTQTLTFSTLLTPKYQDVLQIPSDVLAIITKMNEERNRLHFISDMEFSIGKSVIDDIRQLINFVGQAIIPCILNLNQNMAEISQAHTPGSPNRFTV